VTGFSDGTMSDAWLPTKNIQSPELEWQPAEISVDIKWKD
jgi:hypothetical protein